MTSIPLRTPWIRNFHPTPDAPATVVFFPHAGGSASYFFDFSVALSGHAQVLAVQYPGRQERAGEPCLTSIAELSDRAADDLAGWTDGRPLVFFGHSMGAIVAYEVALRLATEPAALYASGRRAPSRSGDENIVITDERSLVAELLELGGTADSVLAEPALLRMPAPVMRADYQAIQAYRHRPVDRLRCPVTVVYGTEDPRVTDADAEAWAEHTAGTTALRTFPGGHFYLREHRAALTADIARFVTGL
ncbi:thioesterase II family protein [Kutzneria sp. NPDC052558]|uniref:thioesterase II family protein n=1 Tax=Kutzneria sp. NPDC052558 TaxID=3364121 RepID=UPI0037C7F36E